MSDDNKRPNMAAGVQIPPMQPNVPIDPRTGEPRTMVRDRPTMRRPVQGVGQPQALAHRDLVNHAHGMLEQYKKDPESVDSTFVQLMMLEGLCAYGGQLDGLKQEIARLRKEVQDYRDGGDPDARTGARAARRGRRNGVSARPVAGRGRRRAS